MYRTYKSKIDRSYQIVLWFFLIMTLYGFWMRAVGLAVCCLIISVFMLESLLKTDYIITTNGELLLRSGMFPKQRIDIKQIKEIKLVNSINFAYALSCERLVIVLPGKNYAVSPLNKKDFIRDMRKFNHNIKVIE